MDQKARNAIGSELCKILSPDLPESADVDDIEAALTAAGYAIVPVKPTRAMTIEAEKMGAGEAWAEDCWAAMLNAAQDPTDEARN